MNLSMYRKKPRTFSASSSVPVTGITWHCHTLFWILRPEEVRPKGMRNLPAGISDNKTSFRYTDYTGSARKNQGIIRVFSLSGLLSLFAEKAFRGSPFQVLPQKIPPFHGHAAPPDDTEMCSFSQSRISPYTSFLFVSLRSSCRAFR